MSGEDGAHLIELSIEFNDIKAGSIDSNVASIQRREGPRENTRGEVPRRLQRRTCYIVW